MALTNFNSLLISGRWSNKDPKDAQILTLVEVAQKMADESNKLSDKSNSPKRESTNGDQVYSR